MLGLLAGDGCGVAEVDVSGDSCPEGGGADLEAEEFADHGILGTQHAPSTSSNRADPTGPSGIPTSHLAVRSCIKREIQHKTRGRSYDTR